MSDPAPVTRASLRNISAVVRPAVMTQLPTRVWSDDAWARIRRGYEAQDMDQKWNVFVEDRTAFLHRSWTGRGIFEASFVQVDDGGWRIGAAVVEAEPGRYRRISAHHDRVALELVLCAIVLGEPAAALVAELAAAIKAARVFPSTP